MKCKTFREYMYEYMEGNLSRDMEKAMDVHREQCMECRELFEEEKAIDKTFKRAFDSTYVEFSSTRTSVLESINRNKYSAKSGNKLYYKFCKDFRAYGAIAALLIGILILAPFIRNFFRTSGQINPLKYDGTIWTVNFDITSEEMELTEDIKGLKWSKSKDNRYSMAIYNEDYSDMKEFIFITDRVDNKNYKLIFQGKTNVDIKICEVKWIEDNNIMLLLSDEEGKLQGGNKLLVLNLENLSCDILYETKSRDEIFTEFTVNHNQIRIDTVTIDETGRQIGKGVDYVDFKDITNEENNEGKVYLDKVIKAIKDDDYEAINSILLESKINEKYIDSDLMVNRLYEIGNEREGKREFLVDFLCIKEGGSEKRYIERITLERKYERIFLRGLGVE